MTGHACRLTAANAKTYLIENRVAALSGFGQNARFVGKRNLDATHWVGAVKRSAEGSYMQLQVHVS